MKQSASQKQLKVVGSHLKELHRLLLLVLKKDHERISGDVLNPAGWFQVLISDPQYQWIKPLNSLMSDVDALTELSSVSETDFIIVRHELDFLFFKENGEVTSFNWHYRQLFAHNHEVMYSHGILKEAISGFPAKTAPINSDEIRRGWHKTGASKRKLLN